MIDMDAALDATALVLILLGALLCLTAAIGLLRFRDVPTRLHAATKPQVLGLILICLAIALSLRSWPVVAFLVPVVLIQLATAPLSAHMVGSAGVPQRHDRRAVAVRRRARRLEADPSRRRRLTPLSRSGRAERRVKMQEPASACGSSPHPLRRR